jgi:Transposase
MDQVVGIDISKARLDVFCLASGRRLAVGNDAAGVAELVAWLEPGSLVVMEASGGYERLAHRLLTERGSKAAVVNALRVRQFAKAAGLLAKTDRLPTPASGLAGGPGRRRGDRPLRRLRQAGADAGPRRRARGSGRDPGHRAPPDPPEGCQRS